MPPIPASTASRSKLQAFQFHEGPDGVGSEKAVPPNPRTIEQEDKENSLALEDQSNMATSQTLLCPPRSSQSSQHKECPQTPIGRVPLAELIAAVDDNANQNLNLTPVERVLWQHVPGSSQFEDSQDSSTSPRGQKRARSSSPPSSSQNEASNYFSKKESFNFQTLQDTLKTPQADPAGDLWARYSLMTGGLRDGSPTRNGAALAEILKSSSPQTPGSHLKIRSLRRSISCANEWPTSAAKRRKLNTSSSQNQAQTKRPLTGDHDNAKMSRVSVLVEQVQNELLNARAKPVKPRKTPDSSPSTAKNAQSDQSRSPPLRGSSPHEDAEQSLLERISLDEGTSQTCAAQTQEAAVDDLGSDFEDDDFDNELVEAADASFLPAEEVDISSGCHPHDSALGNQLAEQARVTATHSISDPMLQEEFTTDPFSQSDTLAVNSVSHVLPKKTFVESNEDFDDEDNDMSAAEMEDLVAVYDQQPQSAHGLVQQNSTPQIKRQKPTTKSKGFSPSKAKVESCGMPDDNTAIYVSSDDEFGGALDFEDIVTDCQEGTGLSTQELLSGQCVVDDHQNLLVLHPDHLVSATAVGDSFQCTRRAVLHDRVKATNDSSESQVYGNVLHEIFQEAMKANRWDDEWLHGRIELIVSRHLESFFEINVDPIRAVDHLKNKTVALQSWAEVFVSAKPKTEAIVKDRNGTTSNIAINKLLEVEEKVWSPMYGLKGNVDATVQITTGHGPDETTLTVPFELKTGRNVNAAHKAQTALYTLLLSDRYDINVACGILYYMETSEISRVPAIRHELMHMVMQRNELATYIRQRFDLPPMLKSLHLCGQCYAKTTCFTYHKLAENGDGETSGLKEKFDDKVRHLNGTHAQFFKKWDDLLTKEEKDIVKIRREVWTMQSTEREKVGRCFSNVVIQPGSAREDDDAPKINRYQYTFIKKQGSPHFSFLESQLTTGEPIVVSDERGHFALANGYVTAIRKRWIEVVVDRRLNNARRRRENFSSQNHQSFVGIMEVLEDSGDASVMLEQSQEPRCYRIDKDEFSNGMATVRNNLISLMDKDLFGSQALRRLIIENTAPTFKSSPSTYDLGDSLSQANLNIDQRNAIEKVMTAKDYALVLGMPGTGKTTTIAHIIRALTARGKSVLLASYTHTAVDNILLKIRNDNIGVFRLGAVSKVHPDVQDFADLAGVPMKTTDEIKTAYSRPVVATTCLGINHPVFNQKIFDYCIVDEASQITLPVCLGPIRMARTFILVGDHYQLPPLVQNKEAQEGGLDVSLFKILSDNQPSSVVNLEHQYRMCEEVMTLSNTLIYNGRLKCGNNAVAQRSLRVPRMEALKQHHHTPSTLLSASLNPKSVCLNPSRALCWLRDLLDPSVKVCFVNTDPLLPLSRESESGSRIVNTCEATLCAHLVQSLLTTGVPAADIGVITLYRSQLALIKQNLRQYHPAVEMHTADKFQGRDKEVVILSLVRSNESQNVGDLLKDWRRVNVALTRARTKLLILGSKSTMKGNELLDQFVKLVDSKGWTYNLPVGAMEGHVFDDGATPLTAKLFSSHEPEKATKKSPAKSKRSYPFFDQKKGKENKKPKRMGKVTEKALLGSRPVLQDIVNDAS
ncbi:MAG: hypothetical protein Q9222_007441 [Ikaeria aurantiellina]